MSAELSLENLSFNESIWIVLKHIPPGRVCSYGTVADLAGFPGRARQVASALRAAPSTFYLPWHRVVTVSGHLGIKPGDKGFDTQVARLRGEGIIVRRGRVDVENCGWRGDLDELLWADSDVEPT